MESDGQSEWAELPVQQDLNPQLMLKKSQSRELESLQRINTELQEQNSGQMFQKYQSSHLNHGMLSVSKPIKIQIIELQLKKTHQQMVESQMFSQSHQGIFDTTAQKKEAKQESKKCEYDEELCSDQGSIMNEQSEEGTAPDYDDSVFDNDQMTMIKTGAAPDHQLGHQKPNEFKKSSMLAHDNPRSFNTRPISLDEFSDLQTPVYKRQRLEEASHQTACQGKVTYKPSDLLAFSQAESLMTPRQFNGTSSSFLSKL